jgi:hypothetical protein
MNLHQAVAALAAYHPRIRLQPIKRGSKKGWYIIHLNYPAAKRARRDGWDEDPLASTAGGTLGFLAHVTWLEAVGLSGNGGWYGTKDPDTIQQELGWKGPVPRQGVSGWHIEALEWLAGQRPLRRGLN